MYDQKKICINTGLPLYLETWKNLEFDNLGKKNLEKPGILNKKPRKTWNFKQF